MFCKHNLQSNVSSDNVLAILQAADRMRAADIKEYALKMIVHHFGLVRMVTRWLGTPATSLIKPPASPRPDQRVSGLLVDRSFADG